MTGEPAPHREALETALLRRRRRPGRDGPGLPAREGRGRRRGPGEARRLPPRLPRRHHPPVDPPGLARTRAPRRFPEAPAPGGDRRLSGVVGGVEVTIADFSHLPTRCRFIAFMPQWDFLDFVAGHAERYPTFRLRMNAEVNDLIEEGGEVVGVRATTPTGRSKSGPGSPSAPTAGVPRSGNGPGSRSRTSGAPIDVLWMRLSRRPDRPRPAARPVRPRQGLRHALPRRLLAVRLTSSRRAASTTSAARGSRRSARTSPRSRPFLRDRVGELKDWDDVKLLTVAVDRLTDLAPAGPALHRRLGARDVADRRRRDQPGDPGRGRRRPTSSPARSGTGRSRRHDLAGSRSGGSSRPG